MSREESCVSIEMVPLRREGEVATTAGTPFSDPLVTPLADLS